MTLRNKLKDNSELLCAIDGTENRIIDLDGIDTLSSGITQYNSILRRIIESSQTLADLELSLRERFPSTEEQFVEGIRIANCVGWSDAHIRRAVENILCDTGETDHTFATNIGEHVIDPLGWASKVSAPSEGYGILGKIEACRPSSSQFDQKIYDEVMNTPVAFELKGAAVETNSYEAAYMPTVVIHGADEYIQQFSANVQEGDVSTAKHVLVNS